MSLARFAMDAAPSCFNRCTMTGLYRHASAGASSVETILIAGSAEKRRRDLAVDLHTCTLWTIRGGGAAPNSSFKSDSAMNANLNLDMLAARERQCGLVALVGAAA